MALTDVDNATLSNITTTGNSWGGVAIYTYGRYYPLGSSNVTVSGLTASEGNPLYIETGNYSDPAHPSAVVGFSAPQFGYTVHNPTDKLNHSFFQVTETNAISFALAFPLLLQSYIIRLSDGALILAPGMSIQAAVNAAAPGDTINVPAGTYTEQVFINKSLTLVGENRDTTIIKAPATIPVGSDRIPTWLRSPVPALMWSLSGFTVSGPAPAVAARSATASWFGMARTPISTITRSWISVMNPSAGARTELGSSSGALRGAQQEQLRSRITSLLVPEECASWSATPDPAQRSPATP